MGEEDTHRQAPNVARMKLLGAEVVPGDGGQPHAEGGRERGAARLGRERGHTHYIIGSVVGPHPFPWLVRDLQRVIGDEARARSTRNGPRRRSRGRDGAASAGR